MLLPAFDLELRREPRREMLAEAFGLTAAEADVAIGIASGKTWAEIAVERGVKIGTRAGVLEDGLLERIHAASRS